jgi:ubiquinone/menaquinone biosynthesis C-methylase UbiE
MTRPGNDTNFVDPENVAEIARQEQQGMLLTKGMGGILPELGNQLPQGATRVLDLACGPGEWVRAVAEVFPQIEVTGLDMNESILAYARSVTKDQRRENIHFVSGNVRERLPFPDACFDLVNARALSGVLKGVDWEPAMREWYRITRPGGLVRLTELQDRTHWNQPAGAQLNRWLHQFFRKQGYGFDAEAESLHLTPMLGHLLQQTGWQEIREYQFPLDFSNGSPYYWSAIRDARVGYRQLWPVFQTLGLSLEEIERTYQEMLVESTSPDLRLACSMFTVNAIRPTETEERDLLATRE